MTALPHMQVVHAHFPPFNSIDKIIETKVPKHMKISQVKFTFLREPTFSTLDVGQLFQSNSGRYYQKVWFNGKAYSLDLITNTVSALDFLDSTLTRIDSLTLSS